MSATPVAAPGFDAHTAVEPHPGGWLRAEIDPQLRGFAGTHGGYVAALALRAMGTVVDDPQRVPLSLTVQLLAAVRAGEVDLHPGLERSGSSMTVASLRVRQDGRPVVAATPRSGCGVRR